MVQLIWLWSIIAALILGSGFLSLLLYRQGKYVKAKYPERYVNQLGTTGALMPRKLPFPFNFGTGSARHGSYSRQFKKIIDIAQAEKDAGLLERAERGYRLSITFIYLFLGYFFVIMIGVLIYDKFFI
jgi:hypothetical protein